MNMIFRGDDARPGKTVLSEPEQEQTRRFLDFYGK